MIYAWIQCTPMYYNHNKWISMECSVPLPHTLMYQCLQSLSMNINNIEYYQSKSQCDISKYYCHCLVCMPYIIDGYTFKDL